ncbi:MAG: response regulator [Oligoflexales bacterium]|nr:response regulator [Oligoflexales bacterium]
MAKILIVDDSMTTRKNLKDLFEQNGYEVVEASNGVSGLKSFNDNEKIDAIISDINMPEMDGLEFCREIKKHERGTNVPILVVTAVATKKNNETARKIGVDGIIVKPFRNELLLEALGKIIK